MSSNIKEVRAEVEQLRKEFESLRRETLVYSRLLNSTLSLMSRAGVTSAADIRRYIALLYSLEAAYKAVQIARMASGDPLAWIGAGVEIGTVVLTIGDVTGMYG